MGEGKSVCVWGGGGGGRGAYDYSVCIPMIYSWIVTHTPPLALRVFMSRECLSVYMCVCGSDCKLSWVPLTSGATQVCDTVNTFLRSLIH